jgi:dihydroorotate dehydrogenase
MLTKLLHLLPAEVAHRATLTALKYGLGPKIDVCIDSINANQSLAINIFDKQFRNPLGLAAGADKNGEALEGWARMGFGHVEVGTVTYEPRYGNLKPRIWRTEGNSIINFSGLPNRGYRYVANNLAKFQDSKWRNKIIIGLSIAPIAPSLCTELEKIIMATRSYVDYFILNPFCPNIQPRYESFWDIEEQLELFKNSSNRPVLLKDKLDASSFVSNYSADGYILCNGAGPYWIKELDIKEWPLTEGRNIGAYSGPKLFPYVCKRIQKLRKETNKPIIGVGGIQSGQDAREMLACGANAVQIFTGLTWKGPSLIKDILQTLEDQLATNTDNNK